MSRTMTELDWQAAVATGAAGLKLCHRLGADHFVVGALAVS
jgi:hypothetical protein